MSCAMAGTAITAVSKRVAKCFILLAPLENKFLHAPGFDLTHNQLIGVAAIHHMDHLPAWRQLAGMAELAQRRAVQLSLVNLSRARPGARTVAVGIGVGHEQILVRPFRDAVGPGAAEGG